MGVFAGTEINFAPRTQSARSGSSANAAASALIKPRRFTSAAAVAPAAKSSVPSYRLRYYGLRSGGRGWRVRGNRVCQLGIARSERRGRRINRGLRGGERDGIACGNRVGFCCAARPLIKTSADPTTDVFAATCAVSFVTSIVSAPCCCETVLSAISSLASEARIATRVVLSCACANGDIPQLENGLRKPGT
jgi:hypothetical protein